MQTVEHRHATIDVSDREYEKNEFCESGISNRIGKIDLLLILVPLRIQKFCGPILHALTHFQQYRELHKRHSA